VAIVVIVGLAIGCAPGAGPPPAAAEEVELIPIGISMGLTGAVATCTMPESWAHLDYLTWINDEGGFEYTGPDGKVHKAKYDIMWADNGFQISRSISIFNRFVQRGAKFMLTA
jgi:hypothetical protein